jgi:hypothetical protein
VGRTGTRCDLELSALDKPRFPISAWKKAGVDALLVTGSADCAVELSGELRAARASWPFALGLDASHVFSTLGRPALVLKAGAYPDEVPEGGWYEALGYDAGTLAARALEALPEEGVARGEDVSALRVRARDALAVAEAELRTSGARGFGGARILPRELRVLAGGPSLP